jgi:hypothetical protein
MSSTPKRALDLSEQHLVKLLRRKELYLLGELSLLKRFLVSLGTKMRSWCKENSLV